MMRPTGPAATQRWRLSLYRIPRPQRSRTSTVSLWATVCLAGASGSAPESTTSSAEKVPIAAVRASAFNIDLFSPAFCENEFTVICFDDSLIACGKRTA
jgi:hypothetical protein